MGMSPFAPAVTRTADRACAGDSGSSRSHAAGRAGCLLLVLIGFCSVVRAATPDSIDAHVESEMLKRQIPGLALAVVQEGVVTRMRGYGLANVELDVPVSADTVFELASVTKQFTATAIMLLVEEQKVALDDPVAKYLPPVPDSWREITIHHLLTHTAGLPRLADGFKALYRTGVRVQYTTAQMFFAATQDALSFAPGERFQYSDVGYFLLGMVIEKVSGRRYGDFVTERFFQPLGMRDTGVPDQSTIVKNRAAGYTLRDGKLVHIRRIIQMGLVSHYGVFSSVRDLAKWEIALASGKVLARSSLEQMWTPTTLNDGSQHPYGYGWNVWMKDDRRVVSHSGVTGTEYARYRDDGLTVIVLTNLGRTFAPSTVNSWGIAHDVAAQLLARLSRPGG